MKIGKHGASSGKMLSFVNMLNRSHLITKVILGKAQGCFHTYPEGSFKIRNEIPVGLRLSYYAKQGIRDVYISYNKVDYLVVLEYLENMKGKVK